MNMRQYFKRVAKALNLFGSRDPRGRLWTAASVEPVFDLVGKLEPPAPYLAVRDGKVVWITETNKISRRRVSQKALIQFLGFPLPASPTKGVWRVTHKVEIQEGDPMTDNVITIFAKGGTWEGVYRTSKTDKTCIPIVERRWAAKANSPEPNDYYR
jgi:hypothetical protein